MKSTNLEANVEEKIMSDEFWTQVAGEAIDHLFPYGPVIVMGLESARRQLGRDINRRDFVSAKSIYALLKASVERDQGNDRKQVLDSFVQDPGKHREQIIVVIAQEAINSSDGFGHKLIALTNRWRKDKRSLPTAGG
jgi:hypothetical protein